MSRRQTRSKDTRRAVEARYRDIILRALKKWRPITGADRWTVSLDWASDEPKASMAITVQPEYFDATLAVDMQYLTENQDKYTPRVVEYDVVHELSHLFLGQIHEYAIRGVVEWVVSEENERATSRIARALWVAHYGEEPPATGA